jgi:hypothetical protein
MYIVNEELKKLILFSIDYDELKKNIKSNILMNNNILENINNYDKLKEENKINEIIKIIKNKFDINNIQKSKNYLNILQNEQLFNLKMGYIQDDSTKYFQ